MPLCACLTHYLTITIIQLTDTYILYRHHAKPFRLLHLCFYSPYVYSFCFFFLLLLAFISFFFFFNDTATTEIYTLSLHDALPISNLTAGAWNLPGARVQRGLSP